MIKLIKNELFKIFHKKGLYIVFLISVCITGLITVLNNIDLNSMNSLFDSNYDEQMIKEYEAGGVELDDFYVNAKTSVAIKELMKKNEKATKYFSPEYYFLINQIQPLYLSYYANLYIYKDEKVANMLKEQIDQKIKDYENFDWTKQIKEEIEEIKTTECDGEDYCIKTNQERLFTLNYRLENNIPYSYKDSSGFIEEYYGAYTTYLQAEKDESKIQKREDLLNKREAESKTQKGRYKLDNKLIKDNYSTLNSQSTFIGAMGNVSIFVVVCIVLVASSVIADEFNKGTIKQLLVRPFSRSKIIISKLIAILTTIMLFVIIVSIGQTIVSGIINQDFNTLIEPYVMYNFNTHSVITTNTIFGGLLWYACILPEIVILTLLTILVSVLFTNNGVSTAAGIVTYAAAGILELYISIKPIISYIPLVNWDFSIYLFGAIPESKYLVLSKSLYVCISTVILLSIAILLFFKHKDIKNQ